MKEKSPTEQIDDIVAGCTDWRGRVLAKTHSTVQPTNFEGDSINKATLMAPILEGAAKT